MAFCRAMPSVGRLSNGHHGTGTADDNEDCLSYSSTEHDVSAGHDQQNGNMTIESIGGVGGMNNSGQFNMSFNSGKFLKKNNKKRFISCDARHEKTDLKSLSLSFQKKKDWRAANPSFGMTPTVDL